MYLEVSDVIVAGVELSHFRLLLPSIFADLHEFNLDIGNIISYINRKSPHYSLERNMPTDIMF
jgi:hypothetical protein